MLIIVIEIRIHRANAPQYLLKYSAPHMLPETRRPALQKSEQQRPINIGFFGVQTRCGTCMTGLVGILICLSILRAEETTQQYAGLDLIPCFT